MIKEESLVCKRILDGVPDAKCEHVVCDTFESVNVDFFPFKRLASIQAVCDGDDCFLIGDIPVNRLDKNKHEVLKKEIGDRGGEVHSIHPHGESDHFHPLIYDRKRVLLDAKLPTFVRNLSGLGR